MTSTIEMASGDPSSALDCARAVAAFLGGVTAGAVAAVIRRYRSLYQRDGTVRQLHVVLISTSYLLLVAALTYGELRQIGQPATRISWLLAATMIVALPIGLRALWLILGHAAERSRRESER